MSWIVTGNLNKKEKRSWSLKVALLVIREETFPEAGSVLDEEDEGMWRTRGNRLESCQEADVGQIGEWQPYI